MKLNSKTKFLILGLLTESPLSGYDIKKIVDLRFKYFWSESYGQIYPQLKELKKEGLVTSLEEKETGRNTSRYQITEKGQEALKKWLNEPVEKETNRYELLLKLYFADSDMADVMIEHIKVFQIEHKKQQQLFTLFEKNLKENMEIHGNHAEELMVLSFGQKVWAAYDEWCNEVIELLEKEKMKKNGNK